MTEDNMYAAPTATENITLSGNIDKNDKNLQLTTATQGINTKEGFRMTFMFYDRIGEEYTVQMYLQDSGTPGTYDLVVSDVCNSEGDSIFVKKTTTTTNGVETTTYSATGVVVQLGGATYTVNGQ
mgnify:FL=1